MADEGKVTVEDVMHALLAKMRARECDGEAALTIAEWMVARLEPTGEGEPEG